MVIICDLLGCELAARMHDFFTIHQFYPSFLIASVIRILLLRGAACHPPLFFFYVLSIRHKLLAMALIKLLML